ncbi:hypothetical protein BKA62DRAFT_732035, partial [Auriculariales sp. MPI-PUGE-AT-0066]
MRMLVQAIRFLSPVRISHCAVTSSERSICSYAPVVPFIPCTCAPLMGLEKKGRVRCMLYVILISRRLDRLVARLVLDAVSANPDIAER